MVVKIIGVTFTSVAIYVTFVFYFSFSSSSDYFLYHINKTNCHLFLYPKNNIYHIIICI